MTSDPKKKPAYHDEVQNKARSTIQGELIQLEARVEELKRALAGAAEKEGVDAKVKKHGEEVEKTTAGRIPETMDGAGSGSSDGAEDQDTNESSDGKEDGHNGDRKTLRTMTTNGTNISQIVTQVASVQEGKCEGVQGDRANENVPSKASRPTVFNPVTFTFDEQSLPIWYGHSKSASFAAWHQAITQELACMVSSDESDKIRFVASKLGGAAYGKVIDHAKHCGNDTTYTDFREDRSNTDFGFFDVKHMLNFLTEQYDPDVSKIDMRFGQGRGWK